jgi:uncharacterized protein (TIGR03086 family)
MARRPIPDESAAAVTSVREMTPEFDLAPAAEEVRTLARNVTAQHMDGPTPCGDWTVRDLIAHIVDLSLAFRQAAETTPPRERAGSPKEAIDDEGEWRRLLDGRLDELVEAWRRPAAWDGMTEAGGVTLPAPVMAQVAVDELVLHGWDLARSTGQPFDCDPANLDVVLAFTAAMSQPGEEAGREGLFGPVVPVASDAPAFDRALGASGRDPGWSPSKHPQLRPGTGRGDS